MPVYLYLEVRCLGCDTHQTVALDIVQRPKTTPIHELERYNAMPGLLAGSRLSLQAQLSGRAANDEDFSERSAINVVVDVGGKRPTVCGLIPRPLGNSRNARLWVGKGSYPP
jgi:hypothetical protein